MQANPMFVEILDSKPSAARKQAEAAVAQHYAQIHGAAVTQFLPTLMALHQGGKPVGVLGVRDGSEPFFLERYLASPVEDLLATPRSRIVEVGNMVALCPGGSRHLIAALTAWLDVQGYSWSIFTATAPLRNAFRKLGIPMHDLGPASMEAVSDAESWGRYYEANPRVTAVAVVDSAKALVSRGPYANTMRSTHDALAVA
jgi:hypothetical protein